MSKKFASLIVIMCTLVYLTITLYCNNAGTDFFSSIRSISILKNINISPILKLHKAPEVIYDDVKQKLPEESSKNAETANKAITNREQKLYIMKLPKSIKDMKLARIHQSNKELLDSIFEKAVFTADNKDGANIPVKNTDYSKQNVVNKSSDQKKEDQEISAFNMLKNNTNFELTTSEKERLLATAKKLSPIDQAKINEYLKENSLIKNALNLFRDRLSDTEFGKIKDIADRYNKAQ